MRAHCSKHDGCTRQRTVREGSLDSSHGQGRPIGLLCAWLASARNYETKADHMAARVSSLQDRRAARAAFLQKDGAAEFAADHERARGANESEEPTRIR